MGRKILITGGMRSGKSAYALRLARSYPNPRVFVATAEATDEEMRARIVRHRRERGNDFHTIEAPIDFSEALRAPGAECSIIVIDCLTLWMYNVLNLARGRPRTAEDRIAAGINFVRNLPDRTGLILVTNEVGSGLIPEHAASRHFLDQLGFLNQTMAAMCDGVVWMLAGIPNYSKGGPPDAAMARAGSIDSASR